jgi:hypothetical protein
MLRLSDLPEQYRFHSSEWLGDRILRTEFRIGDTSWTGPSVIVTLNGLDSAAAANSAYEDTITSLSMQGFSRWPVALSGASTAMTLETNTGAEIEAEGDSEEKELERDSRVIFVVDNVFASVRLLGASHVTHISHAINYAQAVTNHLRGQ